MTSPRELAKKLLRAVRNGVPRLRSARGAVVVGGTAAVLVALGAGAWWFVLRGEEHPLIGFEEPPGFALTPTGENVPRLEPVRVTFERPPDERKPERLLQLEPSVKGTYAWITPRTLVFQPDVPGYVRGATYTVIVPARPEAGVEEDVRATFTVEGELRVQYVIPGDGEREVPLDAQIFVQFNRSVALLTMLEAQQDEPVLTFDPPLEGTGEWLNTSLYRFVPEDLAPSTTYRVTVRRGLSAAVDGVLREDFTWSFTTVRPAVSRIHPDDGTTFASPWQEVVIEFNQPMAPEAAEGIAVVGPDGTPVAGTLTWNDEHTAATFRPSGALAHNTTYTVRVAAGLPAANGDTTSEERTSRFTTVGVPGVQSTEPPNGATNAERYGIKIRFTNPMDEESLQGRISVSGIADEELGPLYLWEERELYIPVALEPATTYTVTLQPGARDRYGQEMAGYSFSFTTGQLPSDVRLLAPAYAPNDVTPLGVLLSSSQPVVQYQATNVGEVEFALWRLPRDLRGQWPDRYAPFAPERTLVRRWTEHVQIPPNRAAILSTSLTDGTPLEPGYYQLEAQPGLSEMFLVVTNTVVVAKRGHGELFVWVLEAASGEPLSGVPVTVMVPGEPERTAVTDEEGTARLPVPPGPFYTKPEKATYTVLVDDGEHFGIAHSSWWPTGFYDLDVPLDLWPRGWAAHLYTDRPLYRPGETVHYKVVLRRDNDKAYELPPAEPPFDLVLLDPRGEELERLPLRVNEFGSFVGQFEIPEGAPIGDYTLLLLDRQAPATQFGPAYRYDIGTGQFRVAEFRKPEFELTLEPLRELYVSGDTIEVDLAARYYFGGPVADAPVEWSALSWPAPPPEGYERFSFAEEDPWADEAETDPIRASGDARTSEAGTARLQVPATLLEREGPRTFLISATVTDVNAQAVAGSTSVEVRPGDYIVGIRPEEFVATTGEPAEFLAAVLDAEDTPVSGVDVVLQVYRRRWIVTKEEVPGGGRRYRSDAVDTLIDTLTARSGADGVARFSYRPQGPGTLRVVAEVRDGAGRAARAATYVWVHGPESTSWFVGNTDTFALVPDKERYEVGEVAEVLVPAPFAGATALVTVERGNVWKWETRLFVTNDELLRVPVEAEAVPNVYLSVVLYRPPSETDPVPRYAVGYAKLTVSTSARALTVSVTPKSGEAAPGDRVRFDVEVRDGAGRAVPAELAVAVVDEALLALHPSEGPDGLSAFWSQRLLGVATASSMSASLERFNFSFPDQPGTGKGGGGFEGDITRQQFRNTALWIGQLPSDEQGRASFELDVPDNLTRWRVLVRAITRDTRVGDGTALLVVTKPLIVRPALPRFLRRGDEFQLRAVVQNRTDDELRVTIDVSADGVELSGDAREELVLSAQGSALVAWPAAATRTGTATVRFDALAGGGLRDSVVVDVPVHPAVTLEPTATGGVVTDQPAQELLYLPPFAIREEGSLEILVQASLLGALAAELEPLRPQAWESTVDIAARLLATAAVERLESASGEASAERLRRIRTDVAVLVAYQRPEGGWAWCPRSECPPDPFVTSFVLLALGKAKKLEVSVPSDPPVRAWYYLREVMNQPRDVLAPSDADERALMLLGMASVSGSVSDVLSPARAIVQQERSELTDIGRAALVLTLDALGFETGREELDALLTDLADSVIPSATGAHWEQPTGARPRFSPTTTTALVVWALSSAAPDHPLLPAAVRWLVYARAAEDWQSPSDRSLAVAALAEYALLTGERVGDFAFQVLLDGDEVLRGRGTGESSESYRSTIPLTELSSAPGHLVEFAREFDRPGRLYYVLNLRYAIPATGEEALNRGFAVARRYTRLDDPETPVTRVRAGDVVRVTVTVVAQEAHQYVQVEDLLPAGLEAIDTRLATTDPALVAQLEAERRAAAEKRAAKYVAPWVGWYWNPWQATEVRDDRVVLFANYLPPGVYEYTYYARATTPGSYLAAPARAFESLFPDLFGRSDSSRFVVEP